MKNRVSLLFLLLLSVLSAGFELFPKPRAFSDKGTLWPVTAGTQIIIGNQAAPADTFAARLLSLDLKNVTGLDVPVVREGMASAPAGQRIVLGNPARDTLLNRLCQQTGVALSDSLLKPDSFYNRLEGYELDCGTDILIAAPSDHGVFYGTRTLYQLLDTGKVVHRVRATDWPRYPFRGYMLDMGRSLYKVNQVKRLLRLWSRVKINTLQLHLHDDQLNSLKYNELPLGRENPRAWTMADLADIIAYAGQYHVEVVPELECIGHSNSIIYWYPELDAHRPGLSVSLNTADHRTYNLYEAMFNEILPLIQSGYLHVGTDESVDLSPRYYFFTRLQAIIDKLNHRHGKQIKLIQWTGPAVVPDSLADRIVLMPWDYSMTIVDTSVHDALWNTIHGSQQRTLGGAAGWMDNPSNPKAWAQRFNYEPNFFGVVGTNWSLNTIDNEHNQWMSVGNYCWNPQAPDNMAWSSAESRMPEMRNPASIYADAFRTHDDYWRILGNPAASDTPGCVRDGIYLMSNTPVAPTAAGFDSDTLPMHPVPDPADTLPIASMRIFSPADTVAAFTPLFLSVLMQYTTGPADTSTRGAWFVSLDTMVAAVSRLTGEVTGRAAGTVRVTAEKRGRQDTITLTITPSSATLDSIRVFPDSGEIAVTGRMVFGARLYYRMSDSAFAAVTYQGVTWSVDSPLVAAVSNGTATGLLAGGPVAVMARLGAVSDTARLNVRTLPPVIRRINFQCWTPLSFRPGWEQDNGAVYDSVRGFGWATPVYTCRNDRRGATFLQQSLIKPDIETHYRVAVPDGEYLLRVCIGDNAYGDYYAYVMHGPDTLVSQNRSTNTTSTDTVTVSGGAGLDLIVKGAINYLVIASQVGTPLDLVANDDVVAVDLGTPGEKALPALKENFAFKVMPNPFNPSTRFDISLPMGEREGVRFFIYDLKGRRVQDLTARTLSRLSADGCRVEWRPERLSSGLYVAVLHTKQRRAAQRVLFIK